MIDLRGKAAIVTGSANGIGAAIVRLFREAGATVLGADLEDGLDVRHRTAGEQSVQRLLAAAGRMDILVNNAAWLGPGHALLDSTEEEWTQALEVNLLGTRNFTQAALPHMLAQGAGCIVNIASVQAIAAARDSVAYTTTKAGLIGFTRSLAYDYGPSGIRANCICPGAIRTRISPAEGTELHARQIAKTFLGRIGSVDDVAYAALYLASDASCYVTGAVLPVDGGWSAM